MKRVVMIAFIMAVITSLFAFSVYAAPSPGASYNTSISSDDTNITAYAYAVYEEGVYQISSQGTEITSPSLLISVRVVNNTDKWVIKDTDQFKLRINGIYAINYPFEFVDIENCTITEVATASGRADLTIKGNNSFILAPNETYVITFRMVVYDGFTTPSLQFFNNQFLNNAYTIGELVSLPANELAYLSSLNEDLQFIIQSLDYSGNLNNVLPDQAPSFGYTTTIRASNNSNFVIRASRLINKVVVDAPIYYVDPADDTTIYTEQCHVDVTYFYRYRNLTSSSIYIDAASYQSFNFETPSIGGVQYEIVDYKSSFLDNYMIWTSSGVRYLEFYPVYRNDSRYMLVPVGDQLLTFTVRYYFNRNSSSDTFTLPSFNASTHLRGIENGFNVYDDEFIPETQGSLLYRIWQALSKPSGSDNTEEAQEMNDEIHDAEQVWYDNNTEALEQVGLSNYRFSQSQSSGITQAVTQFQAVWNALGQWTNVYIFILILSISTYIIRHEPTTRVKQYRSSVQAERAERITYYGKKNAESRAASSGSTFKAALRRRK